MATVAISLDCNLAKAQEIVNHIMDTLRHRREARLDGATDGAPLFKQLKALQERRHSGEDVKVEVNGIGYDYFMIPFVFVVNIPKETKKADIGQLVWKAFRAASEGHSDADGEDLPAEPVTLGLSALLFSALKNIKRPEGIFLLAYEPPNPGSTSPHGKEPRISFVHGTGKENESAFDAVKRELRDELGIDIGAATILEYKVGKDVTELVDLPATCLAEVRGEVSTYNALAYRYVSP